MSRSRCVNWLGLILLIYVAAYVAWSRHAIQRETIRGSDGYYFFERNGPEWASAETFARTFYAPCIFLDVNWFGGTSYECLNELSEHRWMKSRIFSHDDLPGGKRNGCT